MASLPPPTGSRLDRLLGDRFALVPFAALEAPYKQAVLQYLAVDPARFEQQHGAKVFGVTVLSSQALKAAVMQDPELAQDHKDWESYHAWYVSCGDMPAHPADNRWPVILSSDDSETLQDGWHRMHSYLRRGDDSVPALFFPQPRHLARTTYAANP